ILQTVVRECGIPEKIIQDCNPLLLRNDTDWSIDEQLQGKQEPTQVGNAMQDFSIEPVFVRTKRQQRYFERIFELFHICLLEELQQQQIADLPDGNAFLETSFIHSFNQAYALQSETIGQSWRPVAAQMDVEQVCSFRYKGRKNSNNTVKVGDVNIPLHDTTANRLRPGSNHIDVRQLLDGSWRIYSQDTVIGEHPPTPLREPVRMKVKPQRKTTRAASLTWTYPGGS
ncbi:MAG: hypothetical protein GY868_05080, partial [Deltaproteobacteria bacterium]|nr:hypothetical protein [Deltaproteobacteria bacterium]